MKVARIHEHIANARADYLHKLSTEIIKNHDVIGMEDLQVRNILKNRKLAKKLFWYLKHLLLVNYAPIVNTKTKTLKI